MLQVANEIGGSGAFSKWWAETRPKLVKVAPLEWGDSCSQRNLVILSESGAANLAKRLGGNPGRCIGHIYKTGASAGNIKFGTGTAIDLDANGDTWEWTPVEFPVAPLSLSDPSALRELFRKLDLNIKLFWKPHGKRYFALDRARMVTEIKWNVVAECSSKRSHVRSRDRD